MIDADFRLRTFKTMGGSPDRLRADVVVYASTRPYCPELK